ncbi:MAG TPA: glycosyltransferase family 4 protein [Marmoricola sp.]|nr:glycosyltransferase family 4 protein [Marmoricola sp.]
MKIGLIAPPWIPVPPPAYGGTEAVVDNLARGLTARGHDVVVFTVGTSACPVERRQLYDEPAVPMGQSVAEATHVLAAYEELRDVDLIHDHTVLGPLIAQRSGMPTPPVVTTSHGAFTPVTLPIYRVIARTAAVVAISADQASRSRDVPITAVIHHGVDLELYRPGPVVNDHIVFIGRMSPDKGVDRAVQIAKVAGRPLRIITKMRDADEIEYYEDCVRPMLSAADLEPEELPLLERISVLQSAAALVNPIVWPEPFGLVMAESLATGTPVVASPVGAAPEIVTDGTTGFLRDSDDEAADAIRHVGAIDRGACRSDAERRFSSARMAADHERLYRRILERSAARRTSDRAPAQRSDRRSLVTTDRSRS